MEDTVAKAKEKIGQPRNYGKRHYIDAECLSVYWHTIVPIYMCVGPTAEELLDMEQKRKATEVSVFTGRE